MFVHYEYHIPQTWDEAATLLKRYGDDARLLAGGTVLMNQIARGLIAPRHIISLDQIPGWDTFNVDGGLVLSAGTTFRQIERTLPLDIRYAALSEAAQKVGSVQVRNVGTVAGNLCNASPGGDAIPPLLVMDARLTVHGTEGTRIVAAHEFITGHKVTVLRPGELLRQITISSLPERTATVFLKTGRRRAMEISVVNVAVRLSLAPDSDVCIVARIALGAVAPTPIRAGDAEKSLEGQVLTPAIFKEAAYLAARATSPISDLRASAAYRLHLAETMVRRGLEQCFQRLMEAAR
jgi:CO/xanthine dehydrogenase FAD-binding subunit